MKTDDVEENFLKALLVTIGFMALFSLFIFIPGIGFVIATTFGAYVAGYKGARYSVEWRKLGFIASVIWSTVLVFLMIFIVLSALPFSNDLVIAEAEILIIFLPYVLNFIFCILGARARFKEEAVYV